MQKPGHFTNQILKICKIHRKLRVELTSVLFCKYLRNQSSDLYEILYGGQSLSWEPKFQISWRSMHKCARTKCKRARARFIATARVYCSCARICAWIFMKFETLVHKIVIDHHKKFHKDQSFGCGDICKTKLTLVQPLILYVFCISSKFD